MSKVQWRPQLNALTTPQSYRAQPVPKESLGYDEMAVLISTKNPLWSPDLVKSILLAERETRKEQLVSGNQVSYENNCTWHLSISARLNAPDDALPQNKDIVNVQVYASRAFVDEVRQDVELERLPPSEKAPVIVGTEDTVLKLADVLNPDGVLRLSGADLFFDPENGGGECVIEGTRNGKAVQHRFAQIANSAVLVVPKIPKQADSWNNEYRVSVSTRYTEHGSLRTGMYSRRLRAPLEIALNVGGGILSGAGAAPLVSVTGGALTAAEARVRVQAVLNAQSGDLRLSLLDMSEGGAVGNELRVAADSAYTLPGFAGSPLTALSIAVNDYAALLNMARTDYLGRVVDILDVVPGT
jgi:hypothetical protein